ncbi:MAG: hypothetical protein IPJ43_11810 [Saprospiraceae bacterium]|nr:hypothetical protein [Saprospiraceae bacterium]
MSPIRNRDAKVTRKYFSPQSMTQFIQMAQNMYSLRRHIASGEKTTMELLLHLAYVIANKDNPAILDSYYSRRKTTERRDIG